MAKFDLLVKFCLGMIKHHQCYYVYLVEGPLLTSRVTLNKLTETSPK